jgi:predicted dienelactone hydrolase
MKELGRESGDLALAVAFVCAACSSTPTVKPDQRVIEQFVSNGYQPPRHETVRSEAIDWIEADISWHFELLVPERVDRAPLVVYLPGLGQDEQAGERWTRAWAQAGYAVMSIQPLTEDQQAWSSDNARSGNFDAVARQGFSDAAMKRRLQALNSALVQLGRRAAAGDPMLHSVDLSRVAVAGFDLGAYSAMVIAGQQLEATDRPALSTPVRAVIALSPFADASAAANDQRFSAILGPVLNITGMQDVDAYGLIESARLRTQPFQLMPPGDKYLVSLALGSHGLIGGADPAPVSAQLPDVRRTERPNRGDEPTPDRRGRKRQSSAAADPDPSSEPDDAAGGQAPGRSRASRSELLTRQALSSASVRIVTTAFLDAYLRGDPAARSWLNQRARQWLTPNASLAIR